MKIDTTLKSFLVPDLQEYTPPFGTKVIRTAINNGGLSTQEVNDNIMMPFAKQRPLVITEDSETDKIEYNAAFIIAEENITLALKDAFIGCVIKILFAKKGKIEYTNVLGETNNDEFLKNSTIEYIYTGDGWFCLYIPEINALKKEIATLKEQLNGMTPRLIDFDNIDVLDVSVTSGTVYDFTADEDCFVAISQEWSGESSNGRYCYIFDSRQRVLAYNGFEGYGSTSNSTCFCGYVFVPKGTTIKYMFKGYNYAVSRPKLYIKTK